MADHKLDAYEKAKQAYGTAKEAVDKAQKQADNAYTALQEATGKTKAAEKASRPHMDGDKLGEYELTKNKDALQGQEYFKLKEKAEKEAKEHPDTPEDGGKAKDPGSEGEVVQDGGGAGEGQGRGPQEHGQDRRRAEEAGGMGGGGAEGARGADEVPGEG